MIAKKVDWFKRILDMYNSRSIKFKILYLYTSIIIFSLVFTSFIIYISAEKQLKENVNHITNETVKQMNNNISDRFNLIVEQLVKIKYDPKLISLVNSNLSEAETIEKPEDRLYFSNLFKEIYSYDRNYQIVRSMIIFLSDGRKYYFTQDINPYIKDRLTDEDYKMYLDKNKEYKWVNLHNDNIFVSKDDTKVVSVATPIKSWGEVKAVVIINIYENYLRNIIEDINLYDKGYVMLLSEDGQLMSSKIDSQLVLSSSRVREILNSDSEYGAEEYTSRQGDLMVIYNTLRINGWKIVAVLKKNELMKSVAETKYMTIYIVIAVIIFSASISYIVAYGLTKPINKLAALMSKAQEGNYDIRFNTKYNDEIGVMADQFNIMLEKTKNLLQRVEEEQKLKRKSELKTLQMQINPHFLYNTLDSIKFLAEQKSEQTSEMVMALGQFYRLSLGKGQEKISIEEEIEHLRNYLIIQKIRYSTQFDYYITIGDDIKKYGIIKFILQPLVENSIYHGIKRKRGKGRIEVKGERVDGDIMFTIYDDGAGIPQDKLDLIRENLHNNYIPKESGIGLYNVHKRLNMDYGEPYGIEIDSERGRYTCIKILLPVQEIAD